MATAQAHLHEAEAEAIAHIASALGIDPFLLAAVRHADLDTGRDSPAHSAEESFGALWERAKGVQRLLFEFVRNPFVLCATVAGHRRLAYSESLVAFLAHHQVGDHDSHASLLAWERAVRTYYDRMTRGEHVA